MLTNINTSEYKNCECGNIIFEEIKQKVIAVKTIPTQIKSSTTKNETVISYKTVYKCSQCSKLYEYDTEHNIVVPITQ